MVPALGSDLCSPPVLASPGSLTPPPFACVPARPTGTVFVTALRAEERPACPTTCQMTVAPGPQGLRALSSDRGSAALAVGQPEPLLAELLAQHAVTFNQNPSAFASRWFTMPANTARRKRSGCRKSGMDARTVTPRIRAAPLAYSCPRPTRRPAQRECVATGEGRQHGAQKRTDGGNLLGERSVGLDGLDLAQEGRPLGLLAGFVGELLAEPDWSREHGGFPALERGSDRSS